MLAPAMDSRFRGNDELGMRTEFFMGGLTFYGERASYEEGWKASTTSHKQILFTSSSLSPHRLPTLTSQTQISDLLAYLLNLISAGLLRSSVETRKSPMRDFGLFRDSSKILSKFA